MRTTHSKPGIPVEVRIAFLCCGAPMVLFVCSALDDEQGFLLLGSLSILWLAGTGWILDARANQAGGWRELRIVEILLVPILTLATIIAEIVVIGFIALGQMH